MGHRFETGRGGVEIRERKRSATKKNGGDLTRDIVTDS